MRSIYRLCLGLLFAASGLFISAYAEAAPDGKPLNLAAQSLTPPTGKRKLLRWLTTGAYRDGYAAEPEVHPSEGPHGGNVRTYFNSILTEDLIAGNTVFRKGAAMVKELYLSGAEEVIGYAVMIKTRKNSGNRGQGWVFYETYEPSNRSAFYGRGLSVCANCHQAGVDYLLSEFRPSGP